jgi:outer membrane protein OmpA-like peptidoglycan-associated protein/tetratricopeptide (TPR) repeat protein
VPAQSRKEWLRYADDAFKKEDYASAAFFYLKILDPNTAEGKDLTYPYEIKSVQLPRKEKKDSVQMKQKTDSSKTDSSKIVQADTSVKKTGEARNMLVDIRDQYVVHQLAESFRLSHDYENAEKWYEKSAMSKPRAYPDERYWYAMSLLSNGKYEQALTAFENYLQGNTDPESVLYKSSKKKILCCHFALDPLSTREGVVVTELDTVVNGGTTSFAPSFFGDKNKIAFTSARKQSTSAEKMEPKFVCDIFTSVKTESGWEKPNNMGSPISTFNHEGAGYLSPDKQKFYFTRWTTLYSGKKECAIYVSRFLNNQWLQPMKLNSNVNLEGYKSMHPSLNLDGSIIYFASDRPGGKGKMDIWYSTIDEFGNAGPPVNMGSKVNTMADEVTPFFDYLTKTLYFASDGHTGLGGLDIFKSYGEEDDTIRSTPINVGGPINSSRDDAYFAVYKDQTASYFASDRKLCTTCEGGACYKIYTVEKEPMLITLKGKVYHKKTKETLPNTLITLKDIAGDIQTAYIITDETGSYSTLMREEVNYYLKAQKNKFFGDQATTSTIGIKQSKEIIQDFYLDPIPTGEIEIPGIEYDFDKATLRPRSKLILDTLAEKLKLNDNLVVEISSHTDSRGNDDYNLRLSNERAKSCVDYLISKGIEPERLQPRGYGETKLLVSDDEISKLKTYDEKEVAHQKNRRTAFKVVKEVEIKMK